MEQNCHNCGKPGATFKATIFQNGKHSEVLLCQECSMGVDMATFQNLFPLLMLPFLAAPESIKKELFNLGQNKAKEETCPECYELLKTFLVPMLKSIHKSYHIPKEVHKQKQYNKEAEYRTKIQHAIIMENFEEAAKLRDELKASNGELPERKKKNGNGNGKVTE